MNIPNVVPTGSTFLRETNEVLRFHLETTKHSIVALKDWIF